MDPKLVAYLDHRFAEVERRFVEFSRRFDAMDGRFAEVDQQFAEVRAEIAASATETRRHFDVVAERLLDKIQLVGEGVLGLDKKVDRVAAGMHDGFGRVDRRFLHLPARLAPRRRG